MRSPRYLVLCTMVLVLSGQAPAPPAGGTITGTVEVDKKGTVVTQAKDVANVWVYLEAVKPPRVRPGSGWTETIVQKSRTFEPKVLVIPVGATVGFPNKDREDHNVFSPDKDTRNPQWDLGRYGPKKTNTKQFFTVNEYAIYCDLHKEMSATIKVVPSRYFVKVVDGTFTLANIPPGRYKVVAWRPGSADAKSDVIEVVTGATVSVPPLNVHWGELDTIHLRMDGTQYPYP